MIETNKLKKLIRWDEVRLGVRLVVSKLRNTGAHVCGGRIYSV